MNPRLPSRRALLISGAAAVIARPSWPRDEDLPYAILQDFGKITSQDGKITLDLPTHSDAGTSVPLTVTADSPMTPDDYPKSIGLYSSGTPRPRICTLHFTHLGLPVFTTRIRLNGAQDVVAVIETSKGEFWRAQSHVTVTFGACATAAAGDAFRSISDVVAVLAEKFAADPALILTDVLSLLQDLADKGFFLSPPKAAS